MLRLLVVSKAARVAKRTLYLTFFLLAEASGYPLNATRPSLVGTVIDLRGTWVIDGKRDPLRLGAGVPASGIIRLQTAGSDASISIALLNGKYLGMRCQTTALEACLQGIKTPATFVEQDRGIGNLVQIVMNILTEKSPAGHGPFSPTIIRTARSYKRYELVVRFEAGKDVPLDDAVVGVKAANYTLDWRDVTSPHPSDQTSIRWDSRDSGPRLPVRVAGLYSIFIKNDEGEPVSDIALLAATPDHFKTINQSFEHARQVCAEWRGPGASDSQHEFLRAYLISLAGTK